MDVKELGGAEFADVESEVGTYDSETGTEEKVSGRGLIEEFCSEVG